MTTVARRHRCAVLAVVLSLVLAAPHSQARQNPPAGSSAPAAIQHIVVIFQENVSFDHYFATYPHAANLPGETPFTALAGTPAVAGLSADLLTKNPNFTNPANGVDAVNPY